MLISKEIMYGYQVTNREAGDSSYESKTNNKRDIGPNWILNSISNIRHIYTSEDSHRDKQSGIISVNYQSCLIF